MVTDVRVVATTPFEGQKPGTSGLRKRVKVVKDGYYLHNFIQSIFDALPSDELKGSTLLVSGDGRYYNKTAILIIVNIAFGNGVKRVWIGKGGLMSTPAASAVIRERENGAAYGGIVLTASHNPGGPEYDFGVKFNTSNGAPAHDSLSDKIYENTKSIKKFSTCSIASVDLESIGTQKFGGYHTVEIIDPVEDWLKIMKTIFNFEMIRQLIQRSDFSMMYDGMNGVAGIYAKTIFCDELKSPKPCLTRCEPMEDFGNAHPDPNLTYAADLVKLMKVFDSGEETCNAPDFGAAGDGDNDRNMILGKGCFVNPSDSVAVIAAYAQKCIPYFKNGLKGLSRSLPTSSALDLVAKKMNLDIYEVPTGWKFFTNLMDAGKLSICGEESFGTGSDHIREKDGLWAVLSWLSILAYRNETSTTFVSVEKILHEFWAEYGRCYYCRYDYEEVDSAVANKMMEHLTTMLSSDVTQLNENKNLSENLKEKLTKMPLKTADQFTYRDPVDGSVSENQGIRFFFANGARIVWRLSGTGSVGSTIRVYFEKFESSTDKLQQPTEVVLQDLIEIGTELSQITSITGRQKPTVIT